jgi:hypothetical protein
VRGVLKSVDAAKFANCIKKARLLTSPRVHRFIHGMLESHAMPIVLKKAGTVAIPHIVNSPLAMSIRGRIWNTNNDNPKVCNSSMNSVCN